MNHPQEKISDTGLYHFDTFRILTDYELTRAQRYPNPITLVHISLNLADAKPEIAENLKQLFAGILNTSLRVSDIPAHYNDDFLILMPVTDEAGGRAVAQRLIARLRGTRNFADGNVFKFSIHIGIATHPGGKGVTASVLTTQAQIALEQARSMGPQEYVTYTESV